MKPNHKYIQLAPDFDQQYPGADPKATETAMNIVHTADLLIKRIAELLQPFDMSPSAVLVLGILADAEEPLPPNAIAEKLITSRATVTGLLDTLERRGYARRLPHTSDRRMLLIELTDAGRQAAHALRMLVHQQQKDWMASFDAQEQEQLIGALHRLQAALAASKS